MSYTLKRLFIVVGVPFIVWGLVAALAQQRTQQSLSDALIQQWTSAAPSGSHATCATPQWSLDRCPKVNGQCPVCGWQAKPWKRDQTDVTVIDMKDMRRHREYRPYGPTEKIIRCERCNAAFWQDAEN